MKYIWQHEDWLRFQYNIEDIQEDLYQYARTSSEIVGSFQHIDQGDQQEAQLDIIVSEAIRTSEIEGEFYTKDDIRSSLKNCLALTDKKEKVRDNRANGISHLMITSRESFDQKLSADMLFDWHHALNAV